jgi:hypothetical protein
MDPVYTYIASLCELSSHGQYKHTFVVYGTFLIDC